MVEVFCKQLSHKYVGESHAIHVISTTAVIVVMNLQIGSLLCLIQITLKRLRTSWSTTEKRSVELEQLFELPSVVTYS